MKMDLNMKMEIETKQKTISLNIYYYTFPLKSIKVSYLIKFEP